MRAGQQHLGAQQGVLPGLGRFRRDLPVGGVDGPGEKGESSTPLIGRRSAEEAGGACPRHHLDLVAGKMALASVRAMGWSVEAGAAAAAVVVVVVWDFGAGSEQAAASRSSGAPANSAALGKFIVDL